MIAALFAACTALSPLSFAQAQRAAHEGAVMAAAAHPYAVLPWVIYQSRDPLRAVHGRAGTDAIVVETPYERVRYEAYLYRLQGEPISTTRLATLFADARDRLGFLVYAHSRSELDQRFLTQFRPPRLTLYDRSVSMPISSSIFGPSSDFYDVGTFREARFVGSISYGFALPACAGPMRFDLTDGYGDRYSVPFDLRRYR